MQKILIVDLPKFSKEVSGLWFDGYPIHKGDNENSLNYATLFANENNIIPDQSIIKQDHKNFKKTLQKAGFELEILSFPEELNQISNLHHDAVFVRDSGMQFKNFWLKAKFSAQNRQAEADIHAKYIAEKFNLEIKELPEGSFLEFGEVFYLKTKSGTYYFGGVSRSNHEAHNYVRQIIKPDNYILIESTGYHLDTVFSPVVSKKNELIGLILTKGMISQNSLQEIEKLGVELIYVDAIDSSGVDEILGNYAVNTLIGPGVLVNCANFETPGVEDKLQALGIKRFISPLTYFRYAGGSYHCLTNEIY